ncbi:MAG: thioredoxin family protein [Hymenobacter sp.]
MSLSNSTTAPDFTAAEVAAGLSYAAYRQLIDQLLAEDKTTGPTQSDELLAYAQLNQQRMARLDKTVQVQPALRDAVQGLTQRYLWVVITEGWCGDAAQVVPVLEAVARASEGRIDTRYLLRDENLPVIDRYHTHGSRSIPKLIVLRADTLTEVATWGPRPAAAHELVLRLKGEGMVLKEFATHLHTWYAHDKTQTTQQELLALVQQLA